MTAKSKRIFWFLGISLLIYILLIMGFALGYYYTESIGYWRAVTRAMEKIDFLKAIYFSVVSFHTIGYGDIYPVTNQGRMILMIQSFISLFYTSVFAGLLVYFIIKRHGEVFTTKGIYIRKWKGKWNLSVRIGNRSRAVIDPRGRLEAWIVHEDSRVRVFRREMEMQDLECILYFDIDLQDESSQSLRKALVSAVNGSLLLHMKFSIIGYDVESGDQISHVALYNSKDIRFGKMFLNVYSWNQEGQRTGFHWKDFEKIEPCGEVEVREFLSV